MSPLRALTRDIHQNLETPLAEIREVARELELSVPEVRVRVRTGDTPASARATMVRRPPHIVVTTPESLYLLVTARKSRETLRRVDTVIVDEIHATAQDKRGAHLALTLERLSALAERRPQRIGLSATQRPIATVARLLAGTGDGPADAPCTVIDLGHQRALDLAIVLPESELQAVISHEQWGELLDGIAAEVEAHRTTLVFVNTRRLSERLAHLLAERLGPDRIAAHHGSLSRDRRERLEERLRAGDLKALVATASLELGIDIGPVDLVCQVGSPRRLATFLQRVGRSGHARHGIPKGRLYPTTRDELVEAAALLMGVRAGKLDVLSPPVAPLDVLAQHVVAACAAEPWADDGLYSLVRRAAPYADLPRADFEAVVEMLAHGIETGRGRRGAYVHRDRVNGVLRGRRAARIAALTSGGAIPDTADYRVVAEPDDIPVGTVNEDWAIESMAGDIFLLGSTSWRIRRVEAGTVRVVDARGAPPTVPFWLGEAPGRSAELSAEVSALRDAVAQRLAAGDPSGAAAWVEREAATTAAVAVEIVRYLAAAHAALGALPTMRDVIFERFFDETEGMQLVVHAPFGARVNRALGLALRKRFCRRFDFELQAAASDDAVVLSLGPRQSVPLTDVPRFLSPRTVEETLAQALLASPMWQVRWRWNLTRSLLVLRRRGGRRNPPPIQRMEADDLMVAVFPALAGCQENGAAGPIDVPDHPIVRQTMHDCLHEATDVDGLVTLLEGLEAGVIRAHFRESPEPSPLAHEILSGRPYTFLDDAPLEERRTRAVALRRGLPLQAIELGRLDPDAIARVREEARPDPRDAEELHDLLLELVLVRPEPGWSAWFEDLVGQGRAATLLTAAGPFWLARERSGWAESLFPGARLTPEGAAPWTWPGRRRPTPSRPPPPSAAISAASAPPPPPSWRRAPGSRRRSWKGRWLCLEAEGVLLRGRFDPELGGAGRARRLGGVRAPPPRPHPPLHDRPPPPRDRARHRAGLHALPPPLAARGAGPPARGPGGPAGRHRAAPGIRDRGQRLGARGAAGARGRVPSGVARRPVPLRRGELGPPRPPALPGPWPRRSPRAPPRSASSSARTCPGCSRRRAAAGAGAAPAPPAGGLARELLDDLRARGALFFAELAAGTGRPRAEVEEALWDLVARGLVAADGFGAIRALLSARERWARRAARPASTGGLRRRALPGAGAEGRWSLLPASAEPPAADAETLAEAVAEQLLARYGVVFRDLLARETVALAVARDPVGAAPAGGARADPRRPVRDRASWASSTRCPRRWRRFARRGGRRGRGSVVRVSAVDPLNLVGILTPGPRVPALRTNAVTYRDGLPVEAPSAAAVAAP